MLTPEERERFSRHIILKEIGFDGQEKLKKSKVLVVGAGGLGSPVLLYLAAAGIGHIGIIDDDILSLSNLQRQILYKTNEIGLPKCHCAAKNILKLNPGIKISTYNNRLCDDNSHDIITKYDIVIDATDNRESRYVINQACLSLKRPMIYGSIGENRGYVALFTCKDKSTSYEALFPYSDKTETPSQPIGIIGALPGIIGTIQAMTAIKYILGVPVLENQLLIFDAESMDFIKVNSATKHSF